MKRIIKSLVNGPLSHFGYEIARSEHISEERADGLPGFASGCKAAQLSLSLHYRSLLAQKLPLPKLADTGFRVYSQTDEDGIVLFLFAVIGATNKSFVEIGTGNGTECNCANLAITFGWHGLFVDGSAKAVAEGTRFYATHPDTTVFPPKFISALVNRDNVDELISNSGFQGEIDLLSIDIDGMDYWIWEAIECVSPRVVVVEANGKFGMRSITVPYDANWIYDAVAHPHYHGASLPALTKLARRKGYRLVGTNRFGYNAFYVRNDIPEDVLPTVTVESCRSHPTRENDQRLFDRISDLSYVEV